MRLCFYSPYFPTQFGGGEKHVLDIATTAAQWHQVTIAVSVVYGPELSTAEIQKKYEEFYGKSLSHLTFIRTPLGSPDSALTKLKWTKNWDGLFYVSDGSLFFSLAAKNFVHLQTPLKLDKSSLIERAKLKNWQFKNTQSYFNKDILEESWKIHIDQVLPPVIACTEMAPGDTKKKKRIISVGRFFRQLHSKRQDILVQAFRSLCEKHPTIMTGWKLQLVGTVEDQSYLEEIKELATGLPVEFYISCQREKLIQLYKEARIYWHAAGYGKNEQKEPEKVEHFGISTAEAMAAGCIPIVVPKGGQKEVVGSDLLKFGWNSIEDCVAVTAQVITQHERWKSLSADAQKQAYLFNEDRFEAGVAELFGKT